MGRRDMDRIAESIERYRVAFWERGSAPRPPISVAPDRNWMPIHYLRRPFRDGLVRPEDVTPEQCLNDYQALAPLRRVSSDDWIPYAAPWRGIPWLEAICGCPVRCTEGLPGSESAGSIAPEPIAADAHSLRELPLPGSIQWKRRMERSTEELVASAPEDCWIAPTILRGLSDVLNAMRGSAFFLDLYDAPDALTETAGRINQVLIEAVARHFEQVRSQLGGYGTFYGYWSPGPSLVIQEDAMGLCAPRFYDELFRAHNAEFVRRSGSRVLFHLHSTGYRHYRNVMTIPGLAGLELTVEANGPRLAELEPVLREILEKTRLILFVDAHFGDLAHLLRRLPTDGLYLIISDKFIDNESDFRDFTAGVWQRTQDRMRIDPALGNKREVSMPE